MSAALAVFGMLAMQSGVPHGPANFDGMSDQQLAAWIGNAHFYHAANVFRCERLSHDAADNELSMALGMDYPRRSRAISDALVQRYGSLDDEGVIIPIGYRTTRRYCRSIRFVIQDMLRGTAELERRLGLSR